MNKEDTLRNAPPGFKLLAWEGVGLFVPQRWEVGRREGDVRKGFFRVDNDARIVIQLRWWTASQPVPISRLVEQHARTVSGRDSEAPPHFRPTPDFTIPAGPDDLSAVFVSTPGTCTPTPGEGEVLVVWQRPAVARVLMARILIEHGQPDLARVRAVLSGLRLQGVTEERDWAFHDLALKTPPGYGLRTAHLYAGVTYLEFARGRQRIALRRFSAADAVMGMDRPRIDDLERWCRRVYAQEFYDMRYRVEPMTDPVGRPGLQLTGARRLLAPIEMKWLLPRHRRLSRRIDIIWSPTTNKLYCVEIPRPTPELEPAVTAFERSLRQTLEPCAATEPEADATTLDDKQKRRARSLQARVQRGKEVRCRTNEHGRTILTHTVIRPRRLRLLRLLGGLEAGPEITNKDVELDLIGTRVWEDCAGEPRVRDLIESVCARFQISYRESELSVTEFIRAMGSRGLLSVALADHP